MGVDVNWVEFPVFVGFGVSGDVVVSVVGVGGCVGVVGLVVC